MHTTPNLMQKTMGVLGGMLLTGVLLGLLYYFYIHLPALVAFGYVSIWYLVANFVFIVLLDQLIPFIHLFRSPKSEAAPQFDPAKLSVIIACYNGQAVIGNTLQSVRGHGIPDNQIYVVSDASTDSTAEIAGQYGVNVIKNKRNLQKGLSVSKAMQHITTPYILVLDDDTDIAGITIPTNLLDEGWSAVSFNITPAQKGSLLFDMQTFEYARSMAFGKKLRTDTGAVANVSGAIGLFHTKDLLFQSTRHSGQTGGEDQQRTAFVQLRSRGTGVIHTDQDVHTLVPPTWKAWFKQRAFKWNRSVHENFFLYWSVIWSPRTHFILKLDRAYVLFVFLTEPVRISAWVLSALFLKSAVLLLFIPSYLLSLVWQWVIYIKVRPRVHPYVIFLYPIYSAVKVFTRYIAYFYWAYEKYVYTFRNRYHKLVRDRAVIQEYALVLVIAMLFWTVGVSTYRESLIHKTTPIAENFYLKHLTWLDDALPSVQLIPAKATDRAR